MRFLLNFNVMPALARARAQKGHTAERVQPTAVDDAILAAAVEQGAIIVTCDQDFGTLMNRDHLPHAGVVLLRLRRNTAVNQIQAVSAGLADGRIRPGAFVVLSDADVG